MIKPTCFVIQPFDGGELDDLYDDVIEIAVKDAGGACLRSDKILGATPPLQKIQSSIESASVCIAEVTENNPNVFFEAGWAFALKKPIFVLWDKAKRPQGLPFDIHNKAGIPYDSRENRWRKELREKLVENIKFELGAASNSTAITIQDLLDSFLSYCKKHRRPRTVESYTWHYKSFLKYLEDYSSAPAVTLKPFHVMDWLETQKSWSNTYKRGAIVALQVAYNWALDRKLIVSNPIKDIEKPQANQRKNTMTQADYEKFLSLVSKDDSFSDLLQFSWNTDCRPEEIRALEAKYIDMKNKRIIIPKGAARGGQKPRIIRLHGTSLEIASRLLEANPKGKIFLNSRKRPWSKYAVANRFNRYSKQMGMKYAFSDCCNGAELNLGS